MLYNSVVLLNMFHQVDIHHDHCNQIGPQKNSFNASNTAIADDANDKLGSLLTLDKDQILGQ